MSAFKLSADEQLVLSTIEELEMRQSVVGQFSFINIDKIAVEAKLTEESVIPILEHLREKRLILWDKAAGVKSRTGHILWCLLNSTTPGGRPQRNVADLKYIRYEKYVPQRSIVLANIIQRLSDTLDLNPLEIKTDDLIKKSILALSTRYSDISEFQYRATKSILSSLKNGHGAVTIVAGTGAGKSLSYQLPLFIWALIHKAQSYLYKGRKKHCTAILIFPRTVLAQDQYEELNTIATLLDNLVSTLRMPDDFKEFMKFKIVRDFGGVERTDKLQMYQNTPDIIVTHSETLKKRLLDPVAYSVYNEGIDLVLYDEVHLYPGIYGSYIAGLNARIQAAFPRPPVFVGMSATIANPEKYCRKLFSLSFDPELVDESGDPMEKKAVEHHVLVKPRPGRFPLGVALDTTSCLIHNRRDGISFDKSLSDEDRPKSLCFADSHDITARWLDQLNDLEGFDPKPIAGHTGDGYYTHYMPAEEEFGKEICQDCKRGHDIIASSCQEYAAGNCWWFSKDDGDSLLWERSTVGFVPHDCIRSKRLTSQELPKNRIRNIYDLFTEDLDGSKFSVDNIVATSVLEVGVDFRGIKDVVMYGEVRSPASYKQKAGRGAREGNMTDGLFIMSIMPNSPLANFYYRHFYRLVNPTLSPVPLEPANIYAVKAHSLAAVFDYLASQNIDIFNVIEMKESSPSTVEAAFKSALAELTKRSADIENYITSIHRNVGYSSETIAKEAVIAAKDLLQFLSEEIELNQEKKARIIWAFLASRNGEIARNLKEKFRSEYEEISRSQIKIQEGKEIIRANAENLIRQLSALGEDYSEYAAAISSLVESQK